MSERLLQESRIPYHAGRIDFGGSGPRGGPVRRTTFRDDRLRELGFGEVVVVCEEWGGRFHCVHLHVEGSDIAQRLKDLPIEQLTLDAWNAMLQVATSTLPETEVDPASGEVLTRDQVVCTAGGKWVSTHQASAEMEAAHRRARRSRSRLPDDVLIDLLKRRKTATLGRLAEEDDVPVSTIVRRLVRARERFGISVSPHQKVKGKGRV